MSGRKVIKVGKTTRNQLTDFEKGQIVAWNASGYSMRAIGEHLGRDHSTISKFLKKVENSGSISRLSGSGRPRATTEREDRLILKMQKKDWSISSPNIKSELDLQVSEKTIRNRLHEKGLRSYWSVRKPMLSDKNRKARLAWAKVHVTWKPEDWSRVIFSDESPYTLRFQGRRRVWRHHNERYNIKALSGTVKHDIKVNVWGCFSNQGVGSLCRVNGILDQIQYREILEKFMIPKSKDLLPKKCRTWEFQHDNDPKHTAKSVKEFLAQKKVQVMEWPSQSPDLNPIENLWSILDSNIKDRKPKNADELFEVLEAEWKELDKDILESLIGSMKRRCQAVIVSKGGPTRY